MKKVIRRRLTKMRLVNRFVLRLLEPGGLRLFRPVINGVHEGYEISPRMTILNKVICDVVLILNTIRPLDYLDLGSVFLNLSCYLRSVEIPTLIVVIANPH